MQLETACPQCGSWMPDGICPRCGVAYSTSSSGHSPSVQQSRTRRVRTTVALLVALLSFLVHAAHSYVTARIREQHRQQTLARLIRLRGPVAPLSALQGKGTIYLVQLGPHRQTGKDTNYSLEDFAHWLHTKYSLPVAVLPTQNLDRAAWNPHRRQYIAELLIGQIQRNHSILAADPNAYLFGFTDAAMYPVHYNWNSTFTLRDTRAAIISTRGMGDTFLEHWRSHPTATEHLQARLRRILLKDVAILYWHLPVNNDPTSLLEQTLDVDVPADDIYTTDLNPARGLWGRIEREPCLFLTYSARDGVQPLPGATIRPCSDASGITHDPSVEIFQIDLRLGLLVDRHTDFYLPDSIPVRFERATRDGWVTPGAFGISGTHNYDQYLASPDMRLISVIHADGGRDTLARSPLWLPILSWVKYVDSDTGRLSVLRWHPQPFEHFDLTYFGGAVETYLPCDSRALCYQIGYRDAQGRQLTFDRDSRRRLMRLTSSNKSYINLSYGSGNRIAAITDSRGRVVRYNYNDRGQLVTVSYPSGETLTYTYDDTQHLLTFSAAPAPTAASRLLLTNKYEHGLLARQVLADGRTFTYNYSLSKNRDILRAKVHDPGGTTPEILMRGGNESVIREHNEQP